MEQELQQEILLTESTYEKGVRLEKMFCAYMKSELGYNKARRRSQMRISKNNRGLNVDVIAMKHNNPKLEIAFRICSNIALLLIIVTSFIVFAKGTMLSIISLIGSVVILMILARLRDRYEVEHAWVECKNHKRPVSIAIVRDAINSYEEYLASKDEEFTFKKMYFVSASGFIENALKLAVDKKVECYMLKNGIFTRVEYWDDI